jgi:hypothetical protein
MTRELADLAPVQGDDSARGRAEEDGMADTEPSMRDCSADLQRSRDDY